MATTILLWDPRFPQRMPDRFTVNDQVASAACRAGVAATADPAQAGALAGGAPIDPGNLVAVSLQAGRTEQRMKTLVLPLLVAQIAVGLGLAAGVPPVIAAALQVGTLDFSDPNNSNLVL